MDNEWSRDTQKYAVLSWITFLVAAVFTMIFFAFIDPLLVVDALGLEFVDSRNAGYAIGFFFLWLNSWVAGWLTLRLVRRKRTGPNSLAKNN
ncbi:MAG: hypothetical protein ACR2QL_04750 [Woeseiaceae bacterium]